MTESSDEWQCKLCTFKNALQFTSCQMCDSPKSEITALVPSNDSQLSYIICSKCTFQNISSAQICEICGERLEQIQQHQLSSSVTMDENKEHKEVELKIKIRSNMGPELEHRTKNIDTQIFKYNKGDIPIFGGLFVVGSIMLILGIIDIVRIYYTIIAFIWYIISISMAVSLNSDDIALKKRIKILAISYFVKVLIFCLLSAKFVDISISGYITTTSLLSSWVIIVIMFCYEHVKNVRFAKTAKYLLNVKSLIIPVFVHFADIATDFGVTYEYYQRSRLKHEIIDYDLIFEISVCILLLSRMIGTAVIWYHTRSIINCLLQFFDLYLLKTLNIEWKLKYAKAGRVHELISLIESIFESAPQSIISLYIIITDDNKSIVIWLSSILSILSIALRSISQDTRFFSTKSNSKELGWNSDNGVECSKSRFIFCNHPYLIRVIWRLIDVTSYILLCALIWYHLGGQLLIWCIFVESFIIGSHSYFRWKSGSEINVYWWYTLLITLPSSWDSNLLEDVGAAVFGVIRILLSFGFLDMMYQKNSNDTLILVDICLCAVSCVLYLCFVSRQGCYYCCHCKCGDNWVDSRVVTTLSIAGCSNIEEIRDLQNEGVEITQYFICPSTWQTYPRPNDLIQIMNELNYDLQDKLKTNCFAWIAVNRNLDPNMSETEIKMVIQYLKQFCDINVRFGVGEKTAVEWAYLCHQNKQWVNALLAEGADFDEERCNEASCDCL